MIQYSCKDGDLVIQIDFFSNDIIKALVPVRTSKPEEVYFLIKKGKEKSREAIRLRQAILRWGFTKKVEFVPVDTHSVHDINEKIRFLLSSTSDEVFIDLSGGGELMIACGRSACFGKRATAIYADFEKDCLIEAESGKAIAPLCHIGIDDYITAINAKRMGNSRMLPSPSQYGDVVSMARLMFDDVVAWKALNTYITNEFPYQLCDSFTVSGKLYRECKKLLDGFCRFGFLLKNENRYYFTDKKAKSYVYNYGLWLELFVYIKAKEIYSEVGCGFLIDWTGDDGVNTQDNEIDVIILHRSVPLFISCKMTRPEAADVYEVGFLARRFGGASARYAIATTFPVRRFGNGEKGIFKRFTKMNCGLIETDDLGDGKNSAVFKKAFSSNQ